MLLAVTASLLIAVAIGTWISLNIGRGLAQAGLANAVAVGDLGQTSGTSNDEIKDLVDAMTA